MYKLFIPVNKRKEKTVIRGFWKDNDITYYDYIKIQPLQYIDKKALKGICQSFNELALFFIGRKLGYIFTGETEKTEVFRKVKRVSHTGFKGLKTAIQTMINDYKGCTVYIKEKHYLLEVFYND